MAIDVPPPEALPHAVQGRPGGTLTLVSLAVLLVSVLFAVSGQLTLKSAMDRVGRIGSREVAAPTQTVLKVLGEPRLWVGLTLFGISAAFWLVALSRVPLSVAYPIVGLSYVVIVLFSKLILHEHVPALRWFGVIVVAVGIAIVGLSFRRISGS